MSVRPSVRLSVLVEEEVAVRVRLVSFLSLLRLYSPPTRPTEERSEVGGRAQFADSCHSSSRRARRDVRSLSLSFSVSRSFVRSFVL